MPDNASIMLAYTVQLIVAVIIFAALLHICKFLINRGNSMSSVKDSRFANPLEYYPTEEVQSLKQVFYLIMIMIFIITILYLVFEWDDSFYFIATLDVVTSLYLALNMKANSLKEKLILALLIPFSSITRVIFGESILALLDIFHVVGYLYFIKVYYRKFVKYTENNGLGITIMLLFGIILVSFLFTIVAEGVSPIDSMTMVSNAFTSNSFDATGTMMIGKLNSLVLAWSGFIISCFGTATLAVSMVLEYVDRRFDDMEDMIKKKKE